MHLLGGDLSAPIEYTNEGPVVWTTDVTGNRTWSGTGRCPGLVSELK